MLSELAEKEEVKKLEKRKMAIYIYKGREKMLEHLFYWKIPNKVSKLLLPSNKEEKSSWRWLKNGSRVMGAVGAVGGEGF